VSGRGLLVLLFLFAPAFAFGGVGALALFVALVAGGRGADVGRVLGECAAGAIGRGLAGAAHGIRLREAPERLGRATPGQRCGAQLGGRFENFVQRGGDGRSFGKEAFDRGPAFRTFLPFCQAVGQDGIQGSDLCLEVGQVGGCHREAGGRDLPVEGLIGRGIEVPPELAVLNLELGPSGTMGEAPDLPGEVPHRSFGIVTEFLAHGNAPPWRVHQQKSLKSPRQECFLGGDSGNNSLKRCICQDYRVMRRGSILIRMIESRYMPEVFSKSGKSKSPPSTDLRVVSEVKRMVDEGYCEPPWRSLAAMPPGTKFEAQNDDEKVLLLMRKHPVTNLWWIGLTAVLFGLPLFWGEFPLIASVTPMVGLALAVFWYLGLAFFVIQNLLLWFYNVYIVTDERIIDVDFFGLLYKNVNAMQIRKIEDVNYSQVGMFSSIFNYGNVVIQTAAEQRSADRTEEASAFTFEAVPNPDRVVKVIGELMEQEEKEEYEGRTK